MRNSEVHLMITHTHNSFKQRKMLELFEVFLFEFTGRNNSTKQVKITIEERGSSDCLYHNKINSYIITVTCK